jgi:hypothetical protein
MRPPLLVAVVVVAVVAVVVVVVVVAGGLVAPLLVMRPHGPAAAPSAPPGTPTAKAADPAPPRSAPQAAPQEEAPPATATEGAALPEPIDLEALRARLPDNRYWTLGQPTSDPAVAQARAEAARAENELYGKVLSGTATDDEIHGYYDERRRLLTDYAEIARAVLADPHISERDRGLFDLALRMDQDRLAELPRELDAAMARKVEQEQRRADWRRANGQ